MPVNVPVPYAVSGAAIAVAVAIAVYHELPPVDAAPAAPMNETEAVKGAPKPPISHPVRTVPISPVDIPIMAPTIVHPFDALTSPVLTARRPPRDLQTAPKIYKSNAGDVCARHGGRRVNDAARRSWHCVFPKRAAR